MNLYPLLIGLTFLAPTDVTFSVWFFLLLNKIEVVTTTVAGWNEGGSGNVTAAPPYLEEQSAGAYLALAALIVWNARCHLRGIVTGEKMEAGEDARACRLLLIGFASVFSARWGGVSGQGCRSGSAPPISVSLWRSRLCSAA